MVLPPHQTGRSFTCVKTPASSRQVTALLRSPWMSPTAQQASQSAPEDPTRWNCAGWASGPRTQNLVPYLLQYGHLSASTLGEPPLRQLVARARSQKPKQVELLLWQLGEEEVWHTAEPALCCGSDGLPRAVGVPVDKQ